MGQTANPMAVESGEKNPGGGQKMKENYKLPIAYDVLLTLGFPLTVLYVYLMVQCAEAIGGAWMFWLYVVLAVVYWAAIIGLGVANIRQSFQKYREGNAHFCVKAMLLLKYGLIVFFIVNFLLILAGFLLFGLGALVGSRGTIIFGFSVLFPWLFLAIGFYVSATWLMMFPGSFYGIQVIRFSRDEKRLSGVMTLIHGIFQFLFLADVLDALYLAVRKWGMGKKSSLAVGALYVLAVVGALLFLIWVF